MIDLTKDSPPKASKRKASYESQRISAMSSHLLERLPKKNSQSLESEEMKQEFYQQSQARLAPLPPIVLGGEDPALRWFTIEGDDIGSNQLGTDSEWRRIVDIGTPWTDTAFPPSKESVAGDKAESDKHDATDPNPTAKCKCGLPAKQAIVQKDTPNKGRTYFHCENRRCGFFAWADNRQSWTELSWKRFPSYVVVTDYGFSAKDLLQGGVGDCWFLSALAVVAERHDLIAKLFADTTRTTSGCYNIRLFLDGAWRSILVRHRPPRHHQTNGTLQDVQSGCQSAP